MKTWGISPNTMGEVYVAMTAAEDRKVEGILDWTERRRELFDHNARSANVRRERRRFSASKRYKHDTHRWLGVSTYNGLGTV